MLADSRSLSCNFAAELVVDAPAKILPNGEFAGNAGFCVDARGWKLLNPGVGAALVGDDGRGVFRDSVGPSGCETLPERLLAFGVSLSRASEICLSDKGLPVVAASTGSCNGTSGRWTLPNSPPAFPSIVSVVAASTVFSDDVSSGPVTLPNKPPPFASLAWTALGELKRLPLLESGAGCTDEFDVKLKPLGLATPLSVNVALVSGKAGRATPFCTVSPDPPAGTPNENFGALEPWVEEPVFELAKLGVKTGLEVCALETGVAENEKVG